MLNKIQTYIKRPRVLPILIGIIGLVWLSLVVSLFSGSDASSSEVEENGTISTVDLIQVGSEGGTVSTVGIVEAVEEATVLSEASGRVTGVRVGLGDVVRSGDVIAYLSNATEQAAVLQAEAGLESAEASLDKITSGARNEEQLILEERLRSAENSYEQAQRRAADALRSAYANADDAVRNNADTAFNYPRTPNPELKFSIQTIIHGFLESRIERERVDVEQILTEWNDSLSDDDNLDERLNRAQSWLGEIMAFLDDLALGLNSQSRVDIPVETWKANVSAARSLVSNAQSNISNAVSGLEQARSEIEVNRQNLSVGVTGGRPEDVRVAQAAVKQAQASLVSARATLEKTIIRSPISGTIANLTLSVGDFVSSFSQVAIVTSEGHLEVRTSVPGTQRNSISVGSHVRIDEEYEGTVRAIAPAISGSTGQVEVLINLESGNDDLLPGDRVSVDIERTGNAESLLSIPISSVKLDIGTSYVFEVEDDVLIGHQVELGPIIGEEVIVESGVLRGMSIVRDVRGLSEGERVKVQ